MKFDQETQNQYYVKPFFCKICEKKYKNPNGLKYHGNAEHPEVSFEALKGVIDNYDYDY
jgi:hypothetical protein